MTNEIKKFDQYSEIRKLENFQQKMEKLLQRFFTENIDFDIELKIGDIKLNIALNADNWDEVENFVNKLKETDEYFENYEKLRNRQKKFNL
jgi:hypothetical protein